MRSYSTTIINKIYELCSLRKSHADNEGTASINSFICGSHIFDKNRLWDIAYIPVLNLLKKMPENMRRSVSSEGTPWFYVAKSNTGKYWMSFDTADRLVCMGIALDLVTRIPALCNTVTNMEYVIIEDLRQQKMEAVNSSCPRNQRRKTWK